MNINNINEIRALARLWKQGANMEWRYKEYYKDIVDLLKEASYAYYNTDERILTDEAYDDIYRMHIAYGGERIIGSAPKPNGRNVEVDHEYNDLVGSLGKAYNINDVKDWLTKYIKPDQSVEVKVTYKYDGNSVAESKSNGKTILALTRGEDGKGKDLTEIFKAMNIDIPCKEDVGIKYEIIMTDENLKSYSEERGVEYKNPRNTVAGLLNRDDNVKYAKYLTAVPLWVRYKDKELTRDEEIEFLYNNFPENLNTENLWEIEGTPSEIIKDLEELYNDVIDRRNDIPFMIDGLVIEFSDPDLRKRLGYVNEKEDEPKWAIALKFPYMEEESVVEKITFSLSNKGTGIITPMCHFKPVYFNNCEQSKQSLQNYKRYKELGLAIGSPISVQYKGDVLTYIEKLDDGIEREPYPFIDHCPLCNGDVEVVTNDKNEETFIKCGNPECPSKRKGQLLNYCIKMNLKGIGESVIDKLYDAKLITDITSLYNIDLDKASKVIGNKTAQNTINTINDKKDVYDYEILGSLNIENFGMESAKEIFKVMTFDELIDDYNDNKLFNKLTNINGIGDIMAAYVINSMGYMEETIGNLYEILNIKNYKDSIKTVDKALTFVVTGKLNNFKRDEIKKFIEENGHKCLGSVSPKTDYLVNNDVTSTTGKNKKAKELNIPIINEEEFIKIIKGE